VSLLGVAGGKADLVIPKSEGHNSNFKPLWALEPGLEVNASAKSKPNKRSSVLGLFTNGSRYLC
jgi:hypothetical protein